MRVDWARRLTVESYRTFNLHAERGRTTISCETVRNDNIWDRPMSMCSQVQTGFWGRIWRGRATTDECLAGRASYITGARGPTDYSVFGNGSSWSLRCNSESVRNRATAQRWNSWIDRPAFRYIFTIVLLLNKNIDTTSKQLQLLLKTDTGTADVELPSGSAIKNSGDRRGSRSARTLVPWNRASTRTVVATPEGPQ